MHISKLIKTEIRYFIQWIVRYSPGSPIGNFLRAKYWRAHLENQTIAYVGRAAGVSGASLLCLGEHFMLGDNAIVAISDSDPVFIGNNVAISEGSYLRSANHCIDDWTKPMILQGHASKKISYHGNNYSIVIEDDVWVAAHCVILTGAFIGRGSVISAGSVVSSEIPPYSIVVGNPSRVIANRKKLAAIRQQAGDEHAEI